MGCGITNIYSVEKFQIFFLLGLIFVGIGFFVFKGGGLTKSNSVEILESAPVAGSDPAGEIVVEIAGSVEKPGVYKLAQGARIEDLLVSAGGLSVDADRDWVAKNINRAGKLIDGYKLYIVSQSDVLSASIQDSVKVDQNNFSNQDNELININSASLSELDTLPGIGPVYGQSIIEHRPYSTLEELVSKGAIKQSTFEKIKNLISAY